jgi:hypothetical protein
MQTNAVTFGLTKPWARPAFNKANREFQALAVETKEAGEQVRPFWPNNKADAKIVRNLILMAAKLMRMEKSSFMGTGISAQKAAWKETLKNATDGMFHEGSRGYVALERVKERLVWLGGNTGFFKRAIADVEKEESGTMRSYSGSLPGGGRIEVL